MREIKRMPFARVKTNFEKEGILSPRHDSKQTPVTRQQGPTPQSSIKRSSQ